MPAESFVDIEGDDALLLGACESPTCGVCDKPKTRNSLTRVGSKAKLAEKMVR